MIPKEQLISEIETFFDNFDFLSSYIDTYEDENELHYLRKYKEFIDKWQWLSERIEDLKEMNEWHESEFRKKETNPSVTDELNISKYIIPLKD